jgi:hypothetical protein
MKHVGTRTDAKSILTLEQVGFDNYLANAAATGTVTLDLSLVRYFDLSITGNLTLAFSNVPVPSGQIFYFVTRLNMGATLRTITYPTVTWLTTSGTAPTFAASKSAEIIWSTTNGTTFTARVGPSNL